MTSIDINLLQYMKYKQCPVIKFYNVVILKWHPTLISPSESAKRCFKSSISSCEEIPTPLIGYWYAWLGDPYSRRKRFMSKVKVAWATTITTILMFYFASAIVMLVVWPSGILDRQQQQLVIMMDKIMVPGYHNGISVAVSLSLAPFRILILKCCRHSTDHGKQGNCNSRTYISW